MPRNQKTKPARLVQERKRLTDAGVRAIKPTSDTQVRHPDTEPGLMLIVSARRKVWWWRGRVAGKDTWHRLGVFDPALDTEQGHLSVADARTKARWAAGLAKQGTDPNAVVAEQAARVEQEQAARDARKTFDELVDDFDVYLVAKGRRESTLSEYRRFFKNELMNPKRTNWRGKAVADITFEDVDKALGKIRARGSQHSAEHCRRALSSLFRYAVRTKRLLPVSPVPEREVDPVVRDRVLIRQFHVDEETTKTDATELLRIWRAAEKLGGLYGTFIRLLITTGARRSELAAASWSEFDIEHRAWTIPSERMKANNEHRVWLSDLSLQLLDELPRRSDTDLLFPAARRRKDKRVLHPISGFQWVKRRLDDIIEQDGPMPAWRLHDLRRSFATGVAYLGVLEIVADLMIAHVPQRSLSGRSYHHGTYTAEQVRGWRLWSDYLLEQLGKAPTPENVVQLHG